MIRSAIADQVGGWASCVIASWRGAGHRSGRLASMEQALEQARWP
jgi:hypothetical protein